MDQFFADAILGRPGMEGRTTFVRGISPSLIRSSRLSCLAMLILNRVITR